MHALIHFLGRLAAAFAGAAALPAAAERPFAGADDGTAFVRDTAGEILRVLGGERFPRAVREEGLRAIYRARFDGDALAARVAGPAWRGASDARRAQFAALLERYVVRSVATRLGEVADAKIEVTMSAPEGDGLSVYSRIAGRDPNGAVDVRWRLVKRGTTFRIRDVLVENVSLSLHLRRTLGDRRESGGDALEAIAARLERLIGSGTPAQAGAAP